MSEEPPPREQGPESPQTSASQPGDTGDPGAAAEGAPEQEDALASDEADDADKVGEALPFAGLAIALSFLTRLPLGLREAPPPGTLARAMGTFPLVGVVVGGIGAAVYALAHQVLPASMAALLALAATILVTGGLHEDGLADTADGFGGGADRERKLLIMRDSRIGAFGVMAVIISMALRATALLEIGDSLGVGGALVAAHALARAAIPVAMQALVPARADGLGAMAGRPSAVQTGIAVTVAVVVAALALPVSAALAALAGAAIGCIVTALLAQAQIGGHTGDVLGAVEQSAETLALIGALAAL